ncbi:hypothetical protein SAMN05443287_109219 [Micromonospora phaseoli]|uniref:Uncharacterized protein n=1 Tax=Micromonospora phaseoli TaxID=1144548 RepID=A0A1H7CIG7_9ACTN|nr:hypothetical protein [Micromonospora phaseoli]PZV97773.1 hypothetical protein CLV64_10535 [Micromonospora phaseoli]GIJ78491.1 hypothetical protein Xph01_29230 [Micromonospora phaseoli]SEJ89266.1 hypothetical protein SAMN05443287_109219 [Micromonospora phaseoli]
MSGALRGSWATVPADEQRYRPLYARVLGLRFVNPGGVLCFVFFEGTIALAALLALAELVTWWAVLVLPAAVAVMVKLNDLVAAVVVRAAAAVPEQERDRFRRQMEPVVGRARVDWLRHSVPAAVIRAEPRPAEPPGVARPVRRAVPSGGTERDAGGHGRDPGPAAVRRPGTAEPGS